MRLSSFRSITFDPVYHNILFKNSPVNDPSTPATSSGVPTAIIFPPRLPPLWSQIHHPVRRLDRVEVVLDHHHGIPSIAQAVQHLQQLVFLPL